MTIVSSDADGEQQVTLPRNRGASGDARRFVERVLQPRHMPAVAVENALLISSELVSNAFRHGHGSIELRLKVLRDRLRIEVVDQGEAQLPAIRQREANETGG